MTVYLPYRYVDADNYKQYGTIELTEKLTDEQAMLIVDTLDQGEYFIPEQVMVGVLPYSKNGTDADHPWHEFVALTDLDTEGIVYNNGFPEAYNSGPFTPGELVRAFQRAAKEGWDSLSTTDRMAELIAKIAAYPTSGELDDLILEARAIRDGKSV